MPEQFMEALRNVAIVWEEEPSAYHLGHARNGARRCGMRKAKMNSTTF